MVDFLVMTGTPRVRPLAGCLRHALVVYIDVVALLEHHHSIPAHGRLPGDPTPGMTAPGGLRT